MSTPNLTNQAAQSINTSEMLFAMKGAAGNGPHGGGMTAGSSQGLGDSATQAIKFSEMPMQFQDGLSAASGSIDNTLKINGVDSTIRYGSAFDTDLAHALDNMGPAVLMKGDGSLHLDNVRIEQGFGVSGLSAANTPVQSLVGAGSGR